MDNVDYSAYPGEGPGLMAATIIVHPLPQSTAEETAWSLNDLPTATKPINRSALHNLNPGLLGSSCP